MSTILDTPDQIELFHLMQMKYALRIEVATGLRHSQGSIMQLVNRTFDQKFRTKKVALAFIEKKVEEKANEMYKDPS